MQTLTYHPQPSGELVSLQLVTDGWLDLGYGRKWRVRHDEEETQDLRENQRDACEDQNEP